MSNRLFKLTMTALSLIEMLTILLVKEGISCQAVEHTTEIAYEVIEEQPIDIKTLTYSAADALFADKLLVSKQHYISISGDSVLMEEHTCAKTNNLVHVTDWVCEAMDEYYVDLTNSVVYATDDDTQKFVTGSVELEGYYDASTLALEDIFDFLIDNPSDKVTYLDNGYQYEYANIVPTSLVTSGTVDFWFISLIQTDTGYELSLRLNYSDKVISGELFQYDICTDFMDFTLPYVIEGELQSF